MAERPEPAKPSKPEGLQIVKTLPEMEADEQQEWEMSFRRLCLWLKHYADFSTWLAKNGRT